ncbi:hypothetical protein ABMA28_016296 [Loxostege sticticalis]|uniref:Uncharacterized protein n=1 Tax=Loxostege sticticalis TaxID=481309 RepID=A0ABD0T8C6_LOXSC
MSTTRMERAGRRVKAGSLSGLSGGVPSGAPSGVRRQRSLEWGGDRYSSSDDDRPPQPPPLADRVFASLLAQATQQFDGEEMFTSEAGGTLSRRRRADDFTLDNNARNARHCLNNGTPSGGPASERECDSPPEPAPPEVPPRGPSLHVTLRHRPVPCDQPTEPDRLYLSEGNSSKITWHGKLMNHKLLLFDESRI